MLRLRYEINNEIGLRTGIGLGNESSHFTKPLTDAISCVSE